MLFVLFVSGQLCFIKCYMYEYKYIEYLMTWTEAQEYCRKNHTDLATVTNMTDVKKLKTAKQRPKWHWSLPGLSFIKEEAYWSYGEPNNHQSELCVYLRENLTWVDDYQYCTMDQRFICYNGELKTPLNWTNAQRYCRENHTDLISGRQQLDQLNKTWTDNMKGKLSNTATRVFIGLFSDMWAWSNESSFSFRYWDPQSDRDKSCAVLTNKGMWSTDDCSENRPFICYKDHVILIKENRTWEEALYYCRHHHHDLVTITNMDEQRWVQEKTKNASSPFVWTGLRYTCTLGFWFWVSDEVVHYKNWASPGQGNECDMSGAMETGGEHKWFKKHDEEKFNFFCSK
uniref:C-type lectin domain-containing protein n=2 Tax=Oryzias latipes TaxID=8090 RepID=A0A3B3HJU1_ORYLA